MEQPNTHSIRQQCPYLGLYDDPTTALAYPSEWNICYRARPPCTVSLEHQAEACIDRRFEDCFVYQNVLTTPMPPELRGGLDLKPGAPQRQKHSRLLWTVLLAAAILLALWLALDLLLALLR